MLHHGSHKRVPEHLSGSPISFASIINENDQLERANFLRFKKFYRDFRQRVLDEKEMLVSVNLCRRMRTNLRYKSRENKTSFELFIGPFERWEPSDWRLAASCNS